MTYSDEAAVMSPLYQAIIDAGTEKCFKKRCFVSGKDVIHVVNILRNQVLDFQEHGINNLGT